MISALMGGRSGLLGTVDQWLPVSGWLIATDGNIVLYRFSPPGTLKNLRIRLDTAPGTSKSRTFEVFKGITATGITVTISGTDTTGEDLTNIYTVSAGDNFYIKQTTSGSPDDSQVKWSLMFDGDNSKESPLFAHSVNDLSRTATQYLSCGGHIDTAAPSDENVVICVVPTSGTIKNMYAQLTNFPGGTASRTFTVRKNKVDTALALTIFAAQNSKSNTSDTVSVVAGDRISIKSTLANNPISDLVKIGLTFVADTDGEFMLLSSDQTLLRLSGTRYASMSAGSRLSILLVANSEQLAGDAMDIKKVYVHLSIAPASGNDYDFRMFKNGSSTALTCNIADAATTCNHSSTIAIAAGDRLNTRIIPTSLPTQPYGAIGYLGFIEPPAAAVVSAMMMGANF